MCKLCIVGIIDFFSEIDGSDILGLPETHIYDEILKEFDNPGFAWVVYKNRSKIKNVNKASGLCERKYC